MKYLIYLNNLGGIQSDVSVQDVLDSAFVYQASTLKVNNSTSACALEDCTAAAEGTIFSDADATATKTDAVDGDEVSITGSTIDAGDQNVANGVKRCCGHGMGPAFRVVDAMSRSSKRGQTRRPLDLVGDDAIPARTGAQT